MHFTIEDYKKIERWLKENSVKDTEFPETSDLYLNEYLTIIQQGINKKVKLNSLLEFILNNTDSDLDIASTNPVQNQAVTKAIYELQNRNIIKIVDTLPSIDVAESSVIYILLADVRADNNIFTEWIKVNNAWEKVGEVNAEIDLSPYLKIKDAPFKKGKVENSAVLIYGSSAPISEGAVSLGRGNIAGLRGFYYKHIRFVSSTLANIYLSKTQVTPTITTGGEIKDTTINPADYYLKGDIISIVNDNKYNDIAVINNMSEGMIQIKWLSEAPFSSIKTETNLSPEDYSIYCLDRPTHGISDLGKYSFANGTDNKAINTYTEVSGKGNVAKGKFGKVWGKDNIGGYNTTTFGSGNVNLADNSLVNGTNNINEGNNSVIHGNKNKNYGKRAFVVGNENITNNENEAAFGQYNKSNPDTKFSIGIGSNVNNRKNAFEVKENGDIYIEGVEGRIQDKLKGGSSATPDWNTQEGKPGYIKNKTHYIVSQGNVEIIDSLGYDIVVVDAVIDITGQKIPVIIFEQPFINDDIISDSYGNGDLSSVLHVVKGNSILKRFDKSTSEDNDPYFARVTIEDTTVDTHDETTILRASIIINTSEEGYGIDAAEVVGSIYQGIVIPLNEMFIPNTIARKSELTELSAEVGKKQDTITDLADIRSGAAKGATAIQEVKTINGQSIVGSGNIEIQGGGGGGASSDKQGVVSQTLNYNSADNTYSVSNVVRGSIPQMFIDLVTEAGASFNAESGYFSLNGIDNIAYDEMRQIYDCRTGYGTNSLLAVYDKTYTARTNFVAFRGASASYANHEPTTIYTKYLGYKNASITKFALSDSAIEVKSGSANNFDSLGIGGAPMGRSRLEEIIGIICVSNLANSANFFYSGAYHPWLTTFYLKSLKASIDLSGMPRLSEATILYMINNEEATAAITIKLHADAKAMADASEAIQSALENHANITLGV